MNPFVLVVVALVAGLGGWLLATKKAPAVAAQAPPDDADAAGGRRNWLVARGGEFDGWAWHMGSRQVTVGRAPSNFVQVGDPGVSRTHCQLLGDASGLTVVDLTSSNGTVVNGSPVSRHVFAEGDVLSVGEAEFVFHAVGDFDENAAWKPKDSGREARKSTEVVTGDDARRLARALALHQNDESAPSETAEALGVSEDELRALLRR
jgi:predicted component of type VI protein secretion system